MTSTTDSTGATRSNGNSTRGTRSGADDLATTAKGIASDVADRAVAAAQRLPEAANVTGAQIERANEIIRGESDETLMVGTSLSLGLAAGLLLGGSNRLLVIAAIVPATAMALTLLDRHGGTRNLRAR